MPHLSLSLLGAFQARLDSEAIAGFQSDKARALLAFLAVEADQPHRRDYLAGLLWPDWPDKNARANLRHALNNLRTILRDRQALPPFFYSDRQTIQFNPDSNYHLDVASFQTYLAETPKIEAGQANVATIQPLQQAVELYTGPFLSGFFVEDCSTFEEWSLLTRERLQSQMLVVLWTLANHFEHAGKIEAALRYARQRVEFDALQEEGQRHLMRLLTLAGKRSAALVQFETCRQLLADELDVPPSTETTALYEQILSGQLKPQADPTPVLLTDPSPPSLSTPRHNLPAQTTRFIGRTVEVEAVRTLLLRPEVRLLTLTGTGGTGKTRLSLEVAAGLLDHFTDGVFFVPLAQLQDPELVISTIAETVGLRETGSASVFGSLQEFVQGKHLLLVLDNFEHMVQAAPQVADLLKAAPQLKVMVTSRTLLRLYGEHNHLVPPLSLPEPQRLPSFERLTEYEACQLFVERARAIKTDFTLTSENAPSVAKICIKLDGLPLAIELAAARINLLPPQKMLAQLSHRLRFLTRGAKDLPARQQTLRNAIDWSYSLLEPAEQTVFQRLAVFAGGCTIEAADAVANVKGNIDVYDGLESLIDKSLLKQSVRSGEPRFVMLETLREYGLEQLQNAGDAELIFQAYVTHYLNWVEWMDQELQDYDQETRLEQIEIEHDNLRVALRRVIDNRDEETGLKMVKSLWRFWEMRGHFTEGRRWLEEALAASSSTAPELKAEVYTGAGTMAWYQNDYQQATAHHEAALTLYREVGNEQGVAFALNNVGTQALDQGQFERAANFFEECIALCRNLDRRQRLDDKRILSYAVHNLGEVARFQKRYERAAALHEEALALFRELEDTWAISRQLTFLGLVRKMLGDYHQATMHFNESLLLGRRLNNKECIAEALEAYAGLAIAQAQPERAARLWGAAERLREVIGVPASIAERDEYEPALALAYDTLGQTAFASAWAEGRSMTEEEITAYALEKSSLDIQ